MTPEKGTRRAPGNPTAAYQALDSLSPWFAHIELRGAQGDTSHSPGQKLFSLPLTLSDGLGGKSARVESVASNSVIIGDSSLNPRHCFSEVVFTDTSVCLYSPPCLLRIRGCRPCRLRPYSNPLHRRKTSRSAGYACYKKGILRR